MEKWFEKYKSIPLPAKASLWYTICLIIQKGISVLTVPIFTRLLSTADYGVVNVFFSWQGILENFTTLSLSCGVFNNGMAKYPTDRDRFTSSLLGLTSVLTLIWYTGYLLFSQQIEGMVGLSFQLITLMFIQLLFRPAFSLWTARKRYDFQYRQILVATLLVAVMEPVGCILAVYYSNLNPAFARIVASTFILSLIYGIIYIMCVKDGKRLFDWKFWKYGLLFNVPLIPHYLSGTVLNNSDRILIERYCGEDKAGLYSVAYSAAMLLTLFSSAVNSSFSPWLYQKIYDGNIKEVRKTSVVIVSMMAAISFIWILMAPEVLAILAPVEYSEAKYIIPVVAVGAFYWFLYSLFANIQFYYEKTKYITILSICGAALNVILNIVLIPIFGYMAAGYTTLVSYMMYAGLHMLLSRTIANKNGISGIFNYKCIFAISLLLTLIMFAVMTLYENFIFRYLIIVVVLVILIILRDKIMKFLKTLLKK
jgi:O-antigen/teichoic acid export membrane protein